MPRRVFDLPDTDRPDPVAFTIGDVDYDCVPDMPANAVYLLSTAGPVAGTVAFIRACILPEFEERFDAQLARKGRRQVVTQPVLADVLTYLVGEYAARPTLPPENLPGGRQATTDASRPEPAWPAFA